MNQRAAKHPSLEDIREKIRENLPELRERYRVNYLGIFGSWVRGESHSESDLDILVDFDAPPGIFGFIELQDRISQMVGLKVDLVMKSSLKPAIGERILSEVVQV